VKSFLSVITLLCLCAATGWSNQVTLRLVDQNGVEMTNSKLYVQTVEGTTLGIYTSGDLVPLDPGTYKILLVPSVNGAGIYLGQLRREETAVITEVTTTLQWEWTTVSATVNVRDQNGTPIPGSAFIMYGTGGYTGLACGESVILPITDESVYPNMSGDWKAGYPTTILPGVIGTRHYASQLNRDEGAQEIYEGMGPLEFAWKTVQTTVYIRDQNGTPIPGSAFIMYGTGGYTGLACGESVILPITDESVYPNMSGDWKAGYPTTILPGINGVAHYIWDLSRDEGVHEIYEGMGPLEFEWFQKECEVALVDGNGHNIPESYINIPYGGNVTNGGVIHLPTTDTVLYPTMGGSVRAGYLVALYPGGSSVGTAAFGLTSSLEFDPPFVTLGGNQYGIRCGSAVGSISGKVSANCPSTITGLLGVKVDAFEVGTGDLAATVVTDGSGNYVIDSLPAGNYMVTIVTPLGYAAATDEVAASVTGGSTVTVDFHLNCITITANPRSIGFWKHQVGVATGGKGTAQIDGPTLCQYLDLIEAHFNSSLINQVIVYQPPTSGLCSDKLQVAKNLLNLVGSQTMIARARQQLMALLLNIAAGYISQAQVISADGATLSQSVTYCDNIIDNPSGNYELAKTIADQINNNQQVAAGVVPLSTPDIRYKTGGSGKNGGLPKEFSLSQNYPNPFNPTTVIEYALPAEQFVSLKLFDLLGRELLTLVEGYQSAGYQSVVVDASRLSSGWYVYRFSAGSFLNQKRMLLLK